MAEPSLQRLHQELELASCSGAGLGPLAPLVARLVAGIVGAENCVIAWGYVNGAPSCGYSMVFTPSTLDFFTNGYQHLFKGEHERTSAWVAAQRGHPVGQMLKPPRGYFHSNTFNLLIRSLSLHHTLDARIEVDSMALAVLGLFRPLSQPFGEDDAKRLQDLLPALQRVAQASTPADSGGRTRKGYLLVDSAGERILMADSAARELLLHSFLVGHGIPASGLLEKAPLFVRELCRRLVAQPDAAHSHETEVAGGILRTSASHMGACTTSAPGAAGNGTGHGGGILVRMEFTQPQVVGVIQTISQFKLSPLQGHIALFAARGGRRMDCAAQHGISAEALKKHLREIYAVTGAPDWDALHLALLGR